MRNKIIMSCEFETTKMHYYYLITAPFFCEFGLDGFIKCTKIILHTNSRRMSSIIIMCANTSEQSVYEFDFQSHFYVILCTTHLNGLGHITYLVHIPIPIIWQQEIYGQCGRQNIGSIRCSKNELIFSIITCSQAVCETNAEKMNVEKIPAKWRVFIRLNRIHK